MSISITRSNANVSLHFTFATSVTCSLLLPDPPAPTRECCDNCTRKALDAEHAIAEAQERARQDAARAEHTFHNHVPSDIDNDPSRSCSPSISKSGSGYAYYIRPYSRKIPYSREFSYSQHRKVCNTCLLYSFYSYLLRTCSICSICILL